MMRTISAKYIIISTFTLLFFQNLFGQVREIDPSYHVKQDGLTFVFKVLDYSESQLKHYRTEKQYYWYKAQQVFITQGGSSGSLLNGKFEAFYADNQLSHKGYFKAGLKNGTWNYWDKEGHIIRTENWKYGIQSGVQLTYNRAGIVCRRTIIKRNAIRSYNVDTTYVLRRNKETITIHDSLGKVNEIIRKKNKVLDGKQMRRDSADNITYTSFKKGVEIMDKPKKEQNTEKMPFKTRLKQKWETVFHRKGKKDKPVKDKKDKKDDSLKKTPKKPKKDREKTKP